MTSTTSVTLSSEAQLHLRPGRHRRDRARDHRGRVRADLQPGVRRDPLESAGPVPFYRQRSARFHRRVGRGGDLLRPGFQPRLDAAVPQLGQRHGPVRRPGPGRLGSHHRRRLRTRRSGLARRGLGPRPARGGHPGLELDPHCARARRLRQQPDRHQSPVRPAGDRPGSLQRGPAAGRRPRLVRRAVPGGRHLHHQRDRPHGRRRDAGRPVPAAARFHRRGDRLGRRHRRREQPGLADHLHRGDERDLLRRGRRLRGRLCRQLSGEA